MSEWKGTELLSLKNGESMVDQQESRDRELLSELIDSLINQKLLAIRSSY